MLWVDVDFLPMVGIAIATLPSKPWLSLQKLPLILYVVNYMYIHLESAHANVK